MMNSNTQQNQQNKETEGVCQTAVEKVLAEMRALLKVMVQALKAQPNIKNDIKKGLPVMADQLEQLESAVKMELRAAKQARAYTPARRQRTMSLVESMGTPTGSLGLEPLGGAKRGASSPPSLDTGEKQMKKKKADIPKEDWVAVKSRKGRKQPKQQQQQPQKEQPQQQQRKQKTKKKEKKGTKPDAIVLKPADGKSYADILSTIRKAVKPEESGVEIRSIRQTRAGQVLLELKEGNSVTRTAFSDALREATGNDCTVVRELVPRVVLEIRDLDSCTSSEEVEEALKRDLQDYKGFLQSVLTRPNARAQRMAIVTVETPAAEKLMATARIKIGWVNCRIRRRATVTRCYKCLGFGHLSPDCKGPDRSKRCYRCGTEDHKIAGCNATPRCFLCPEQADKPDSRNHTAGSGACGAFREALANAKEKWR